MKILFMADVPAVPDSGAAGTEYQTIEALRKLGHEVETVWADELPHRITHGNLHYLLELPRAYKTQMFKRLQGNSFDVVHVNQPHGYRAARALKRLRVNTAFIHRSHGIELRIDRDLRPWRTKYDQDGRSQLRKLAVHSMARALSQSSRQIARYADGHIVSASDCEKFLREDLGVPNGRIAIIPQAPPSSFFERPPAEMTAQRINRILYVGQYAFFKAPMIVAQVFNRLCQASPDLRFTWVCASEHHEEVRELLSGEARERITLLGWMAQDDLIRVYDEHGVFIFPSFAEGFGKVFLEAMARGLCVVAADNSGAHDVIRHGVNGMLSPTGCVDAMVSQCQQLVHPRLAPQISTQAVNSARSYSWERVASETVSFYNQRLSARSQELRNS